MLWTVIGVPDTFYANDPLDFTFSAFFFYIRRICDRLASSVKTYDE